MLQCNKYLHNSIQYNTAVAAAAAASHCMDSIRNAVGSVPGGAEDLIIPVIRRKRPEGFSRISLKYYIIMLLGRINHFHFRHYFNDSRVPNE